MNVKLPRSNLIGNSSRLSAVGLLLCILIVTIVLTRQQAHDRQSQALTEIQLSKGIYVDRGSFLDDPPTIVHFQAASIGEIEVELLGKLPCVRTLLFHSCHPESELAKLPGEPNRIQRDFVSLNGEQWAPSAITYSGVLRTNRLYVHGWAVDNALCGIIKQNDIAEVGLFDCIIQPGWPTILAGGSSLAVLNLQGSTFHGVDVNEFRRLRPDVVLRFE